MTVLRKRLSTLSAVVVGHDQDEMLYASVRVGGSALSDRHELHVRRELHATVLFSKTQR